jgi:pimeloyl-ACP methyl ester carboxylesterase
VSEPAGYVVPDPSKTFDVVMDDGAIIRVRRHGRADGLRLVLSHGNGFAIDAYYPFWGPLCEDYEVVVFDFRNYGRNPFHGGADHSYPRFVRDLGPVRDAIVAELGARPTVGVFHSMAARANMKRALTMGWLWDAMAVFDPPMLPLPDHTLYEAGIAEERKLADWAIKRPQRFKDPRELAQHFDKAKSLKRWVAGAAELAARSVLRRDPVTGDWMLSCPGDLEARVYLANLDLKLWPAFKEFTRPFKLVGCDPTLPDASSTGIQCRTLAEEQGYGGAYVHVPDTGHFLQIERPQACRRLLQSFLAECGFTGA